MAEVAPAAPATPSSPAPQAKVNKKKAPGPKKTGPSVGAMVVKAVSASKERSGVSLAAVKKALASGGYDVEKNNSRVKIAVKSLVLKGTLVQVKGSGASGSFKINKADTKKPAQKAVAPTKKPAAARKPAAAKKPIKSPVRKATAAKKSPKKANKPPAKSPKKAAKGSKKPLKSPKKVAKKSPAPKKAPAKKAPAKKAAKPKAAKKAAPKKK